jgi:phage tail sheath protein FI
MVQLSYPGVYVEEIPSGVHTITGVPTSVAAFVGYTGRGLDNKAVQIFSWADFERNFGGLAVDSELSYAVQGFFANGGGQAYIVRVPKTGALAASINVKKTVGGGTGASALVLTALSTGVWGNNIVADVDYDGIPGNPTTQFNLTVTDLASGTSESFTQLTLDSTKPNFVNAVVNDPDSGSRLVKAAAGAAANNRPLRTGTVSDPITNFGGVTWGATTTYGFKLTADMPTSPAISNVEVDVVLPSDVKPASLAALARLIQLRTNAKLGAFPGAAVVCEVTSLGEIMIRADFDQDLLPGSIDAELTIGAPGGSKSPIPLLSFVNTNKNVARYLLGKGRVIDAVFAVTAGYDGTALPGTADLVGDSATFTGIYALDKYSINILCIPDATRAVAGNPSAIDPLVDPNNVFGPAMIFCQDKRAFLMIDTPPQVDAVDKATDWRTMGFTVRGNNGAMYFPRLRVPDPLNDYKLRTVAPCGIAAGLYARTDGSRGVWKAPAGIDAYLNGVSAPAVILSDAEQGVLNPIGLNCFRSFPVYGNVTWGARTNEGADALGSEWKYVPVRRLALFMEESLYRGTKWAVFEPNDEGLWAQLRLNIGAFMNSLFVQGAFQGSSPRDAYLVKCDKETTTQNDINNGVVNILVGFAPLKPAEFVVLQIQQMAGQIQT